MGSRSAIGSPSRHEIVRSGSPRVSRACDAGPWWFLWIRNSATGLFITLSKTAARAFCSPPAAEAGRLRTTCRELGVEIILLDEEGAHIEEAERSWRSLPSPSAGARDLPRVGEENEAMLFYTSGTTGTAKGVPLTNRNLCFRSGRSPTRTSCAKTIVYCCRCRSITFIRWSLVR